MTDDKDEDDAGEDRGHGVVTPVGAAGGHGHECDVVGTRTGDCTVDQPVESCKDKHWHQTHHYQELMLQITNTVLF